jgi:hypothetical protein
VRNDPIRPDKKHQEQVQSSVYREPSGSHDALEGKAEAQIVVAVRRLVIVAVRDAAILRVVGPTAAAIHAIVALMMIDLVSCAMLFVETPLNPHDG